MLSRQDQHITASSGNLLDKEAVALTGVEVALDGLVGNRTDTLNDLMAAHELHILQIIHIRGVGVDIIGSSIGSGLHGAGDIAIVHMGQAGSNFNMFHHKTPP